MPEEPPKPDPEPKDKTFTQADLDRVVADRLKRATDKYADYDEMKTKAAQLDAAEEKNKTENQKLLDRLAAIEKQASEANDRVAAAEANALRLEVAGVKGLTPTQAKRLVGTTREELEADAAELLDTFKPATGGDGRKPPPKQQPREQLRGGGEPDDEGEPNITDVVKAIPRL